MQYKWRVLYYPPINKLINNDPTTWRKVFLISTYDCPEELDFQCKVNQLIKDYNMDKEYVIIEDLESETSCFYLSHKTVPFMDYSHIKFDINENL